MKKINNKGFVLVETLVVSIFVLVVFVMVYRNGVPMIDEYKKLETYDDIDTVYAASLIKDVVRQDENFDGIIIKLEENKKNGINFIDLSDCTSGNNDYKCPLDNVNLFETTKLRAGVTKEDKVILTFVDPALLKDNIDKDQLKSPRGFTSYVGYLKNTYVENKDSLNKYMIVVSRTVKSTVQYIEDDISTDTKSKDKKVVKYGSITLSDRKD